MDKCLSCNAELTHTPGRRKKTFCNETCRSNFWYGKNKKGKSAIQSFGDYANMVAINQGKAQKSAKKQKMAQTPIQNEETEKPPQKAPKTLAELKLLCPPELQGFERSAWVGKERQRYGI